VHVTRYSRLGAAVAGSFGNLVQHAWALRAGLACLIPSIDLIQIQSVLLTTSLLIHPRFENINRKEQKKVDKLSSQIPYHEGRGNKEEVDKIKQQVEAIWVKAKENWEA